MATVSNVYRHFRSALSTNKSIFFTQLRCCASLDAAQATSLDVTKPDIVIPSYIPRGPTDILRALASTIKKDPTASHYSFHDDPYLIPPNTVSVRNFALTIDSGRRAARYFLEKYPDLFETDDSQPKIPDNYPKIEINEDTPVTEESLQDFVQTLQVKNAIQAHANLMKNNVSISHDTECDLLELLCFYNSEDPKELRYLDQNFFEPNIDEKKYRDKIGAWHDNGPAEKLFAEMQVKDARAYNAVILGRCKYLASAKAEELFAELKEKNLPSTTKVYNGLIRLISFMFADTGAKWNKVLNYWHAIVKEGLQPDLETFNNSLFMLTKNRSYELKERAAIILAEMKLAGVEPSLATFHHLLSTFCTNTGPTNYILHDIMDIVEHKEWTIRDVNDFSFFTSAMAVCAIHLGDPKLGHRVHAMLCMGDNAKFLEDRLRSKSYYTHYLRLLCAKADLDEFFTAYDQCVPSSYMPEPNLMEELIKNINVQGAVQFLPRLWTDIVIYQLVHKPIIAREVLSLAAVVWPQDDITLQRQLLDITWDLWERIEKRRIERPHLQFKFLWAKDMLENLMAVFVRSGELDKAWNIASAILNADEYIENPEGGGKALMLFCESALESPLRDNALKALTYACNESMLEVTEFLAKNRDKLPEQFFENNKLLEILDKEPSATKTLEQA